MKGIDIIGMVGDLRVAMERRAGFTRFGGFGGIC
jgi:hypothetical protein